MRDTFIDSNALWLGLLWGIFVPIVGYALIETLLELFGGQEMQAAKFSERTRMLVAICLNLIPLQLYQRRRYNETVRGIVFSTMGLAAVWAFIYFKQIM